MSTWAVLAAKQAAIVTGFGTGVMPVIGTGSVDGFVIGALLSGACVTMVTAPGRARRRAAVASDAAPVPSADRRRYFLAAETFEPERGRQVPVPERHPDQDQRDSRQDGGAADWAPDGLGAGGYRSRHRLGEGNPIRQPRQESRRSAPRHAAPPASFTSRMSGLFAGRAVLSAGSASRG